MSILMVGSVALDSVKTPFGEANDALGGSAVHAALAARRFAPVDIVGVVGEDFPAAHIRLLEERGIGLEGLEVVAGGKTFRWGGTYFEDINRRETRFTELNVFESFRPQVGEKAAGAPYVFLANIDPELQLEVLGQCRAPKLTMLDTMNLWIDIRRDALVEAIRRVDIVLMNDEEARQFAGTLSLEKAAQALLGLGCKRAIVKKGEHGCLMFSRDGFFAAPALPLAKVVDPTGAGDTFAGGFVGWLAKQGDTSEAAARQAVVAGTALASFCVEDFSVHRVAALDGAELSGRVRRVLDAISCPPFSL
ncbi:MAG: putative sugar kinase YdjH [candidate division BRC1 bacterium ADurb.BinA364]|nr:MAG: putative sugar kinase YdjH [candidate division BRC1 bacterium ADurb.BinA364]